MYNKKSQAKRNAVTKMKLKRRALHFLTAFPVNKEILKIILIFIAACYIITEYTAPV